MVSEPLFEYYDIHLEGYTVVNEEPEPEHDEDQAYELDLQ